MHLIIITILTLLILARVLECYFFIKKVSKVCYKYDWKYVDENASLLLEILEHKYYVKREWSAYNFLFLKGPNPLSLFLSLKPMKIEKQYNEEAVTKLKKYAVI